MVAAASRTSATMQVSREQTSPLRLSNDGELGVYFIGTGSAFARTLNQNNVLIVKGDNHVLIDCGTKCCQALHELGLHFSHIENFLITHSHADHIGGLEEVQLYGRYVSQSKPNMIINEEYEDILWNQSLRGGSEMSESHGLTFADLWNVQRPTRVEGAPRETWEANIGSLNLKMPRTMHFPDDAPTWRESHWSCGVIIDDRILFTSDTRFDEDLLFEFDAQYDFDVIFHDCQLFTGGVHASINELATLPPSLKSRIVLMHYGDDWESFQQQAAREGFHSWAQEGHTYSFAPLAAAAR